MNNTDVKELLDHINKEIRKVSSQVKSGSLDKVTLKNTLENMRSILDYEAQDILLKLKQNKKYTKLKDNIYFPYGQRENHFRKSVKNNLPPLKEELPQVHDLLESIQPFKSKDNWLVDLCNLTNEAKHNWLNKTENQKFTTVRQGSFIRSHNSKNATIRNNTYNGERLDDVYTDGEGNATVVTHSGGTEITVDNKIKFQGKELEVVPFLEQCSGKLGELTIELDKLLHEK